MEIAYQVIHLLACLPASQPGKIILNPSLQLTPGFLGPGKETKRSLAAYSIHWVSWTWQQQELERHSPGRSSSWALAGWRPLPAALS